MNDEIKDFDYRPDRHGPTKRGRPFFSIRRRFNPERPQELEAEEEARHREWIRREYQWWLVYTIGFALICIIGLLITS